jgi:hypothetical protein
MHNNAGLTLFYVRNWLQPRAASPGQATVHLRLIMSDVERSLLEVHELGRHLQQQQPQQQQLGPLGPLSPLRTALRGHGSSALFAPLTPRAQHGRPSLSALTPAPAPGRSLSVSSPEEGPKPVTEARVARYQRGLLSRRLLVARGTLCFNLVRLRSEFQSLFGTNRDIGVGDDKARALSLTRGSSRMPAFRRVSTGLGRLAGGTSGTFAGIDAVASTMREWRARRTSSVGLALNSPRRTGEAGTAPAPADSVEGLETYRVKVVAQLLALMRRQERVEFRGHRHSGLLASVVATAREALQALYNVVFVSGDELTGTTQYSSLSRDIALLEAPEFEVGMDQKLRTAARMRASYTYLMPNK